VIATGTLTESVAPRPTLVATPALRYWRMQLAVPQVELAERANVGRNTVMRLEAGGVARLSTIRRLAEALQVRPADLMAEPPA
jgi:predicted transcriptional regulator